MDIPKVILVLISFIGTSTSQNNTMVQLNGVLLEKTLIFQEPFEDLSHWTIEQMPGGEVCISDRTLEIKDNLGCTVWYNLKIEKPFIITYNATVIDKGGKFDRVSDLNCFWSANDPQYPDNFFAQSLKRGGKFQNYDNLKLYYVGLGGHDNTKTRFRKYKGDGTKPLLPEYDLDDRKFLIEKNISNKITIIVLGNKVQYYRNEQLIFNITDNESLSSGYFGLRTVNNHMIIDDFKIYKLLLQD